MPGNSGEVQQRCWRWFLVGSRGASACFSVAVGVAMEEDGGSAAFSGSFVLVHMRWCRGGKWCLRARRIAAAVGSVEMATLLQWLLRRKLVFAGADLVRGGFCRCTLRGLENECWCSDGTEVVRLHCSGKICVERCQGAKAVVVEDDGHVSVCDWS